jgi:hypothetical protein
LPVFVGGYDFCFVDFCQVDTCIDNSHFLLV